jgi:phosphate transport system permease protein
MIKDRISNVIIYGASAITVGILVFILGFIFIKGVPGINMHFLTADYDDVTNYVQVEPMADYDVNKLGIELEQITHDKNIFYAIKSIEENSSIQNALIKEVSEDKKSLIETPYDVNKGFIIEGIGSTSIGELTLEEAYEVINEASGSSLRVKVINPGGGIIPMLVTTLMMIGLSLAVAGPIGIFAAIYLVEYAKPGPLVRAIRFGTESLAGIPSIIYGLFGMLFFVGFLNFGYSLLSGSLTISIILLPVIIRQTEESLKAVPMTYREGSLGLGVTKINTIRKVVLPSAIPGIVVAIILSVGRIVGESAALFLTAGTAARIPGNLFESGSTLTVKAYQVAKEEGNIEMACAIGVVIVILVVIINFSSKYISTHFMTKN